MLSKEYKALYAAIHPDAALVAETKEKMRLALQNPHRDKRIILLCGSVAAAVILIVAAVISVPLLVPEMTLLKRPVSAENSMIDSRADVNAADQTENNIIPAWYEPKELTLMSVVNTPSAEENPTAARSSDCQLVPLSAAKTAESVMLELPDGLSAIEISQSDFIRLSAVGTDGPYYGKTNLYYDLKNKQVICLEDHANRIAQQHSLAGEDEKRHNVLCSPVYNRGVIQIQNTRNGNISSYLYLEDGNVRLLSVPKATTMDMWLSSDYRYVVFVISRTNAADIWVQDLSRPDAEPLNITKLNGRQYNANEFEITLSDSGRYILYYLTGSSERWICYDLQKDHWFTGQGKVIRYVADDTGILVDTEKGGKIISTADGTDITDTVKLEKWETCQVMTNSYTLPQGHVNSIFVYSVMDEKRQLTKVISEANGYYVDGAYLYAFDAKRKAVICYSLQNGESFTVSVPQEFFDRLAVQNKDDRYEVYYRLSASPDGRQLVLSYEISDAERTGDYSWSYQALLREEFWFSDSLEELKDWAEDAHQNGELKMYYGNGFSFLWVRFRSWDRSYIAVEDYRDRTFTLYQNDLFTSLNSFGIDIPNGEYPDWPGFRKALDSEASQERTKETYSFLPSDAAPVDYADFYTDGQLDDKKISAHMLKLLFDNVTNLELTHYAPDDRGAYSAWYWNNEQAKQQLIEMLKQLEYHQGSDYFNQFGWWDCKGYWVPTYSQLTTTFLSVYIGRQIGSNKPFVMVDLPSGSVVAFLTEEQYKQFDELLKPEADQVLEEYKKAMQGQ